MAPVNPSPVAQSCPGCRRKFTLTAGPALDGSLVPPPVHQAAPGIRLKWSMVVTYCFAALDQGGIMSGTLDPVVALAPIEQKGIAYADVVSIAIWRKINWLELVLGVLVPVPIALFSAWAAILIVMKEVGVAFAIFAAIALAFGLLAAWIIHRAVAIGRRSARIVGRWASFTVPFDRSLAFYEELFRRCGLAAPPIP
jgi:hypothetical protein